MIKTYRGRKGFAKLRRMAEQMLVDRPMDKDKQEAIDVNSLIHEIQVHQIELEMQNEELRRAQEEIETVRDKYVELYDHAPIGYFTIGENDLIQEVNLTGSNMLGVERRALLNQPFSRFVVQENSDLYYFHRKKALSSEQSIQCDINLEKKDGSRFIAQMVSLAESSADGNNRRIKMVVSDVSERKSLDDALKESENRYRSLVDNMSLGVAVYDVLNDGDDFIFKSLNKTGQKLSRVKEENIIGERVSKAFPNIKEFGLFEVFQRVHKSGQSENHPVTLYNDERLQAWYDNFVYRLESGEIVAIYNDVTRQRAVDDALRESESRFRYLFDSVPASVFVLDKEGKCQDINQFHVDKLSKEGAVKEDFIGIDFLNHPTCIHAGLVDQIRSVLSGHSINIFEHYFPQTSDGVDRYFNIRGVPFKMEGEIIGGLYLYDDVTDSVQTRRELGNSQ